MLKDGLVGTWQLVSLASLLPDGSRAHPFGHQLLGMLMYDKHGNMSVQLMRGDRARFQSADLLGSQEKEAKAALDGAAVYFGTYEVDEETDTVSHHIQGSLFPNWMGTVQRRKAVLDGHRLFLRTEPLAFGGSQAAVVLEWRRLTPSST
ncbi:lipocalin-like domain-containing protein [Myxococcus sp. CA039A]|uniref:lipocalin-like domain-containing protein n=1 Tax=Myxococcus sp. CA039A TaxID=2741737 RepID=UPI00157BA569|nr:lipocalin-like domain-containing protein [Myxococcus sp. CA039A]NTX52235.1 lipocalin-like domain-containing protein [Myxococcus sp. CA039A]